MKLLKKKSEKKNNQFLIIACLAFLLFIIFSIFYLTKNFREIEDKKIILEPREEIVVDYDFEAEVFFNDELGESIFSLEMINSIDNAQKTIEIAVYSMNHPDIKEALRRAAERGVKIDILLCEKGKVIHDVFFADLDDYINRKDIKFSFSSLFTDSYLMHHKFMIIDRDLENRLMFFSSYNFTYLQEKYDPSFVLKTSDFYFIKVFGEEFDRISLGVHGLEKKNRKINPFAAKIEYNNGFIEIWFSPGDKTNNLRGRMINLIKESRDNLKIMIWLWTDRLLAQNILNLKPEIKINIITDEVNINHENSVFGNILSLGTSNNLEVITDEKRQIEIQKLRDDHLNSFLHHHTLIIDDKILVTGTSNFSSSGFFSNDESMIVTDIYFLIESFIGSFEINYLKNK